MSPRWRLILAAAAFLGWMSYLGYAALTKSRAPVISRAQAAAATAAVVANLDALGPNASVTRKLWGDAPDEGSVEFQNLSQARGFTGPGEYLIFLVPNRGAWEVVGQQRSPGADIAGLGPPLIYRWSDDVRKQEEKLRPMGK